MKKKDFLPIIHGSDENAYGPARLFRAAYPEVTPQLVPPCRMGEIARGHDGEAFDHTPCRKIADIEPAAGGAGKARMDMQICAKVFHAFRLAQKRAESQ